MIKLRGKYDKPPKLFGDIIAVKHIVKPLSMSRQKDGIENIFKKGNKKMLKSKMMPPPWENAKNLIKKEVTDESANS